MTRSSLAQGTGHKFSSRLYAGSLWAAPEWAPLWKSLVTYMKESQRKSVSRVESLSAFLICCSQMTAVTCRGQTVKICWPLMKDKWIRLFLAVRPNRMKVTHLISQREMWCRRTQWLISSSNYSCMKMTSSTLKRAENSPVHLLRADSWEHAAS